MVHVEQEREVEVDNGVSSTNRVQQTVFALVVAVVMMMSWAEVPAEAAPVSGFQPGNIISDANFYDSGAMTTAQIQAFLNEKVGRCTIGDRDREPGRPIYGSVVAQKCLSNSTHTSVSKPSNPYCKAFAAKSNESAASLISRVASACGISPRVLLIMLEKEQSLVTDSWPTVRQFNVAMGYACPDSGPNNSANCNSNYFGFANQVYYGAWQLQVYKGNPGDFNYRPYQTNRIQWHENTGCGTSQVYIENWATASLYIYTPYRPNQAALNAGWGIGDACSSYGNRNFYNFYKSWFGSPVLSVHSNLRDFLQSNRALVGEVVADAETVGSGIQQETSRGTLFWSAATGPAFVNGAIRTSYLKRGGATSTLGFPVGIERADGTAKRQDFGRGSIFWRSASGAVSVTTGLKSHFDSSGGWKTLGYPLSDERPISAGGAYQEFERGLLTWGGAAVGAQTVRTGMLSAYKSLGGPQSIGYARAPEASVPGGAWQPFSAQDIHWTSRAGVPVKSGVRSAVAKFGGPAKTGLAHAPEERQFDGTVLQDFSARSVIWSSTGGGAVVTREFRSFYYAAGASYVGYPSGATELKLALQVQETTRGFAITEPGGSFHLVVGGIKNAFTKYGGLGVVGYPVADEELQSDGTVKQPFSNGTIVWSSNGGGAFLQGQWLAYYESGQSASYGAPIGTAINVSGGTAQEFVRGRAYWQSNRVPVLVTGGILNAYKSSRSFERLGFPITPEVVHLDATVTQDFERGQIIWSREGWRVN